MALRNQKMALGFSGLLGGGRCSPPVAAWLREEDREE
jgi:hypothetical protein